MYYIKFSIFFIFIISRVYGQTPVLWGMTPSGGQFNGGVIFSYDINTGIESVRYNFDTISGMAPGGSLIQANDGYLYGMTSAGGYYGYGTIFKFNATTDSLVVIHSFGHDTDGREPMGSLLQANDGNFYGMTKAGGSSGYGMIFKYDPTSQTYNYIHEFHVSTSHADGLGPWGNLIQASTGLLYGMTFYGGIYGGPGTIFSYNIINNIYKIIYSFNGIDGALPMGSLTQANDSLLLGMTYMGGTGNTGTFFRYNIISDTVNVIYNFNSFISGEMPRASLLKVNNCLIYGMLRNGGVDSSGKIFSYNIETGLDSTIYSFQDNPSANSPFGTLMQAGNGLLYGTLNYGGTYNAGGIFSFDITTNTETILYNFGSPNDGSSPLGDLLEVDFPTGIPQLSANNNFAIYPNPANNMLKGSISSSISALTAQIVAIDGSVLMRKIPIQNNFEIDVSHLAPGLYFLKVQNENMRLVRKFVIE